MSYFRLIGYLRRPRLMANVALANLSMGVSGVLGRPVVWGRPYRLMIEPASRCDLRCPLCPTGAGVLGRPGRLLGFDEFRRVFDPLATGLLSVTFWHFGEPFLNPDIYRMIGYAASHRVRTFSSTGGFLFRGNHAKRIEQLLDSGLDYLLVSLDGARAETTEHYRRGQSFDEMLEGMRFLLRRRRERGLRRPRLQLQFIVMRQNEHEIEEMRKLAGGLGVDELVLKSVGISPITTPVSLDEARRYIRDKEAEYLPERADLSRYDLHAGRVNLDAPRPDRCHWLWCRTVVDAQGQVTACAFDPSGRYAMGNAVTEGFDQVWRSGAFMEFRRGVLRNRSARPMCAVCSEGLRRVLSTERPMAGGRTGPVRTPSPPATSP